MVVGDDGFLLRGRHWASRNRLIITERQHLEGMGDEFVLGSNLIIALSQIALFHHHRSGDLNYVHVPRELMVVLRAFKGAQHTTFRTKIWFSFPKKFMCLSDFLLSTPYETIK